MAKLRIILLLLLSAISVEVSAADFVRRFVPREIVNPRAYYPEGPQLLPSGALLVAEMPKDRIVKVLGGSVEVMFEQANCGPTSVKRIPSGGFWILCHLG